MDHENCSFAAASSSTIFITRSAQGQVASRNVNTCQNFLLWSTIQWTQTANRNQTMIRTQTRARYPCSTLTEDVSIDIYIRIYYLFSTFFLVLASGPRWPERHLHLSQMCTTFCYCRPYYFYLYEVRPPMSSSRNYEIRLIQCFSTFFASRTTLCNKKILGNTKQNFIITIMMFSSVLAHLIY